MAVTALNCFWSDLLVGDITVGIQACRGLVKFIGDLEGLLQILAMLVAVPHVRTRPGFMSSVQPFRGEIEEGRGGGCTVLERLVLVLRDFVS